MRTLRNLYRWDTIRTAIVATLIAMLIWVWAEGESVSRKRISIFVDLDSDPSSEYVYRPEDADWRPTVTVEIEGTPAAMSDAEQLVGKRFRLFAGLAGMPTDVGPAKTVRLSEAIPNLEEFRKLNFVVVSVNPPDTTVEVRRMVSRELPLRVELARPLLLDGEPSTSPATVTIRLPEAAAARFTDGVQPVSFVPAEELDRIRGDGTRTVTAGVRLPPSVGTVEPLLISPELVTVNLRIRKEVDSFKLAALPVWFSLPPTEDAGRWEVEVLEKFISDVAVTGPADQIARIRSGETTIKALVELSTDDLNKAIQAARAARPPAPADSTNGSSSQMEPPLSGIVSRQVIFVGLPPGVLSSAANPIVRVRVTRMGKPDDGADPEP